MAGKGDHISELCDALADLIDIVKHRVGVSTISRYTSMRAELNALTRAEAALSKARGDQPDSDPPIQNSATPQGA